MPIVAGEVSMKRIIRLVFSVTILTTIGCKREVHAPPKPEAVRKSAYSPLGPTVLAAAQLNNSLEACAKLARYQMLKELAKDVPQACTGEDGEAGVDALIAKVSEILDAYECHCRDREIS